jgi:phospholipid/cholesterol/gamma-HCH transport system ATP-binding protein
MVEVTGLTCAYDKRPVLQGIDLHVGGGEILVVMGSSGGGKTTLLKCIAGLLAFQQGDVTIDGVSVRTEPESARAKLGLVFQYAALFDYMDVAENVLFGVRRRRKLDTKAQGALVADLLDAVGMAGTERLMPSELSGGMRKRVGLARALALEPSLLLYDEPTSGLDPVTAYSIDQLIVETRDRTGATSIVVSHDVTSVFRVADRIAFLHQGRLLFHGTPSEFRSAEAADIRELVEKSRSEEPLAPGVGTR